jgi:hypothetical protein
VTPIDVAGCGALRVRPRQPDTRVSPGLRPAGTRTGAQGACLNRGARMPCGKRGPGLVGISPALAGPTRTPRWSAARRARRKTRVTPHRRGSGWWGGGGANNHHPSPRVGREGEGSNPGRIAPREREGMPANKKFPARRDDSGVRTSGDIPDRPQTIESVPQWHTVRVCSRRTNRAPESSHRSNLKRMLAVGGDAKIACSTCSMAQTLACSGWNFTNAMTPSSTKAASAAPCAITKDGSDPVGARGCRKLTFWKLCTINTKTLK